MSTQFSDGVMTAATGVAQRDIALPEGESAIDLAQGFRLEHLSDGELLTSTQSMVGRSNLVRAALLAHLAEVEARGLHRERACSSLYTYCVYELRMSEDMAQRRATAAKLVRRFPVLLERVAAGELHLTGLLLLGPHLTVDNLEAVLSLAKHRSKREILKLVRRLDPLPDLPERVQPLGSAGASARGAAHEPTWSETTQALAPVRHLRAGERPREWLPADEPLTQTPRAGQGEGADDDTRAATSLLTEPQRYGVQFTAGDEYVQLLEEARDLLGRATNGRSIEAVHLRAMRLLVRELKRRKCAETDGAGQSRVGRRPSEPTETRAHEAATDPPRPHATERGVATEAPRRRVPECAPAIAVDDCATAAPRADDDPHATARGAATEDPRRRVPECELATAVDDCATDTTRVDDDPRATARGVATEDPRRRVSDASSAQRPRPRAASAPRSRYVSAQVRRAVWQRDAHRCAFVDARGQRCRERSGLELHHETAFAKGGPSTIANLSLRCRAHNALAAEADFGAEHLAKMRGSDR